MVYRLNTLIIIFIITLGCSTQKNIIPLEAVVTISRAIEIKESYIQKYNLDSDNYYNVPIEGESHYIFHYKLVAFKSAAEQYGIWVDKITGYCFIPTLKDSL